MQNVKQQTALKMHVPSTAFFHEFYGREGKKKGEDEKRSR